MNHVLDGVDSLLLMLDLASFKLLFRKFVGILIEEIFYLVHCLEGVEIVGLQVFWLLKLTCSYFEQSFIDFTNFSHSLLWVEKIKVPNLILHVI